MFYQIIVTSDFVDLVKEIPLKYMSVLCSSFVSMQKMDGVVNREGSFLNDLLSQIRNQELE